MDKPLAPFYNQADQDIYTGGDHFIPQSYYRLGNFNTAPPSIANASNTGGITTIPQGGPYMGYPSYEAYLAAQRGGGDGGGGGDEDDGGYAGLGMSPGALGGKTPGFTGWANRTVGNIKHGLSTIPSITKGLAWGFNKISEMNKARKAKAKADAKKAAGYDEEGGWSSPTGRDHAGTGGIGSPESGKGGQPGTEGAGFSHADGGIVGLAQGGRIGFFKAGLAGGDEISPGTSSKGGLRHGSGGTNDGKQNNILKNNYLDVETDLLRADPFVNFNVRDPLDIAKLQATIGYRNLLDNDDLSVEGKLGTDLGLFNTNTNFTETGIGDTDINYGNFSTTVDANKNLKNIGYNNTWNGINYGVNTDLDNTMFSAGIKFNNGGLVGIL